MSSTCRVRAALDQQVLEARIALRVAELRLIAAWTFVHVPVGCDEEAPLPRTPSIDELALPVRWRAR
jgi:hypothetical protein